MGHPDRRAKREKKKEKRREEGLDKKNVLGKMDLTPYNAINKLIRNNASMVYK